MKFPSPRAMLAKTLTVGLSTVSLLAFTLTTPALLVAETPSSSADAAPIDAVQVDAAQLQADLEQLTEWFTGRFDNHWQDKEEKALEAEHPHGRIHSIFAPIDMPELGEHVFYVQQYADGDPSKIYRQRLYSFSTHAERGAVELVIFAPPDPAAVVDAHIEPSKLAGLKVDDLRSYPGCEVYWERRERGTANDHFIGYTIEDACRVVSSRSGRTLVISDDLRLDARSIWIHDRAVDAEGNYVYGHRGGEPHKLWKARFFDCWTVVRKDAEPLTPPAAEGEEADSGEWHVWRGVAVHDQGGRFAMVPEGATEGTFSFEIFEATYRGENTVPVLELAVREKGKDKSVAYAWTEPDAGRLGINLRYLQVGCKLDPDRSF